ncbi:hypothetical protein BGZ83_001237 [Gryganskiella cystojenkinii]|nr:hypothetical protein BGZ83_001237 [Gryganskiella cystojenkinii]
MSSALAELTLFCLVKGQLTAFAVDIMSTKTVGHLKQLICTPARFPDITPERLELWRADIPLADAKEDVSLLLNVINNTPSLAENAIISTVFSPPNEAPEGKLHIIIQPPEQGVASRGKSKRRKWTVTSTILPRERQHVYFVDPADVKKNDDLLTCIGQGKYVLMHGARASGKSARTWRVMEQLQDVTLTGVNLADEEKFWMSFGREFKRAIGFYFGPNGSLDINTPVPDILTSDDFRDVCHFPNNLWTLLASKRKKPGQTKLRGDQFVVIFIDEFDVLVHAADSSVRDSFLGVIHSLKTSGERYAVQSIVGVGTFNILTLNTDSQALSPFNISDAFTNPSFTSEQMTTLFREFAKEHNVDIQAKVVEDICLNTNGLLMFYH